MGGGVRGGWRREKGWHLQCGEGRGAEGDGGGRDGVTEKVSGRDGGIEGGRDERRCVGSAGGEEEESPVG